jgi:hypothetical protein
MFHDSIIESSACPSPVKPFPSNLLPLYASQAVQYEVFVEGVSDAITNTSFGCLVPIPQSLLTHYLSTLCRQKWSSRKRTCVANDVEYFPAPGSPLLLVRRSRPAFSEYVAQQPNHVQRLLRERDLSENATLNLVSLIHSTRSFVCGTDGGLLNGSAPLMSSTRTEMCGIFAALTHLRLIVEFFSNRSPRESLVPHLL